MLWFFFFLLVRWKISGLFLFKKEKFCLEQTRFFFFATSERNGAPERGTGAELEREMVHWRGLVSSFYVGLDFATFNRKLWAGLRNFFLRHRWGQRWSIGDRNSHRVGERDGSPERSGFRRCVGWAPTRSLLPPERDRGEGVKENARRSGGEKSWVCFIWCFDLILVRCNRWGGSILMEGRKLMFSALTIWQHLYFSSHLIK